MIPALSASVRALNPGLASAPTGNRGKAWEKIVHDAVSVLPFVGDVIRVDARKIERKGKVRGRIPNIPPRVDNWEISAETPIKEDITLYAFAPHMHLRGKDIKYTLIWPDGRKQVLLNVPKFDFNWQLHYELAEPMKIPAGSRIHAVAHYDNSIKNRYNPAPNKEVFWSEQSWDEMFIPWFEYTVDSKLLTKPAAQSASK